MKTTDSHDVSKNVNRLLYSITRDAELQENLNVIFYKKIPLLHKRACMAMRLDMTAECMEFRKALIDQIEHMRSMKDSLTDKSYSV